MSETNATITPVQLASRLQVAVRQTGDATYSCPPQMIYNYLTNNVRKLRDRATTVANPSDRNPSRESFRFTDEIATQFVDEMVAARKAREAKRIAKLQQEQNEKKELNA